MKLCEGAGAKQQSGKNPSSFTQGTFIIFVNDFSFRAFNIYLLGCYK